MTNKEIALQIVLKALENNYIVKSHSSTTPSVNNDNTANDIAKFYLTICEKLNADDDSVIQS